MLSKNQISSKKKTFSRRNFLKLLAGALAGSAAGAGIIYKLNPDMLRHILGNEATRTIKDTIHNALSDGKIKYLRQLITADNMTTRRITWQSDTAYNEPVLEYRRLGKILDTNSRATAADVTFTDNDNTMIQYSALLTGLDPDTEYEFRVIDGDSGSDWQAIKTSPADNTSFKMIIFPDSQSSDYSDFENVAQNAWEKNPDARLFTVMGDLVDNGMDHSQWRAWFNALDGIIGKIPFAPVMGNHETYDINWETRLPLAYLGYFIHPENGSAEYNQYYYSFDYGDVHFAVLNTQDYELGSFAENLVSEQKAWLRKDMTATNKKWKIVLMHRDVLMYAFGPKSGRSGRPEGFDDDGINYMPLFDELGIDIVFTAHLHTYRNRGHIYNFDSSDHGPLYILTGVAGNVRYPNLWKDHAFDVATLPQPETDNYLTMDVTPNKITVKCFLPDGTQMDEATVEK